MHKFVTAMACAAVVALAPARTVNAADGASSSSETNPAATPSAGRWCGFQGKSGSIFRCGYSTLEQCKASVGEGRDSYCIPDPKFAEDLTEARDRS
jgi:hypothetical protein